MRENAAAKSTLIFTPRSRPVSRNTSRHGSRAVSPTRQPRSPGNNTSSGVQMGMDSVNVHKVTTWSPGPGNNTLVLGKHSPPCDEGSLFVLEEGTNVDDRYGLVIEINKGQSIAFQGIVDICMLEGAATVHEYPVLPGKGWVRAFSPSSHPLIVINAVEPPATTFGNNTHVLDSDIEEIHALWKVHNNTHDQASVGSRSSSCVIALRSVTCGMEDIGDVAPPYRSFFAFRKLGERVYASQPKKSTKRKNTKSQSPSNSKMKRTLSTASETFSSSDINNSCTATNSNDEVSEDEEDRSVSVDLDSIYEECEQSECSLNSLIGLKNFYPILYLTPDLQILQTPESWKETLDRASTSNVQVNENLVPISPVYLVASGQGNGKSTLSRCLVNRLLSRFGRVFYLETDLGQSELGPPGSLTLSMVSEPLLGPPFTHSCLIEPHHAVYMGITTPKDDPDRYIVSIQQLAAVYRKCVEENYIKSMEMGSGAANSSDADDLAMISSQVIPLVVNTHGWIKGLGLDLLYSICESVNPTVYIQMYDPVSEHQDNIESESYEMAPEDAMEPFIDFSEIATCNPQLNWAISMSYERAFQTLQTSATTNEGFGKANAGPSSSSVASFKNSLVRKGPKLAPYDMRNLTFISQAYLSRGELKDQKDTPYLHTLSCPQWNMHEPLASRRPVVIPWSDLIIWLGNEDMPPSQVFRAINGTIVGIIAITCTAISGGSTWAHDKMAELYKDGEGITDNGAIVLSEPQARPLLRSAVVEHEMALGKSKPISSSLPQIVYGYPNILYTTFVAHGFVRSVDVVNKTVHMILPPLLTMSSEDTSSNHPNTTNSTIHRIIGLVKGPGPGQFGVELPVWLAVDGGYAERSIGSSTTLKKQGNNRRRGHGAYARDRQKDNNGLIGNDKPSGQGYLGIQEAPYLSIENSGGVGSSTTRSRGGQMRKALQ